MDITHMLADLQWPIYILATGGALGLGFPVMVLLQSRFS